MANVYLNCEYNGKDVKAFIQEMISSGIRNEVLAEDGCIQYDYFFSALDENVGVLLEKWRDADALTAHMNGAPMAKIKAAKAKYTMDTEIRRFTRDN